MAIVPTRRVTTREDEGDTLDVAQLVRRAAAGDRWAWEGLVDQYSRLIWAITRDFKLVESDAADVTQVTWLRLLKHIDGSSTRIGWAPGWRPPRGTSACASLAARKKVVLADDSVTLEGAAALSRRSTNACCPPSVPRWSVRPCRACPGSGSRCLSC